jgi:threonine synthase
LNPRTPKGWEPQSHAVDHAGRPPRESEAFHLILKTLRSLKGLGKFASLVPREHSDLASESAILDLQCVSCRKVFEASGPINTCKACGSPLSCRYDYEKAKENLFPATLLRRTKSLWRYREVLPVADPANIVTLGEGFTPIVSFADGAMVKDDGEIPTGTFKARGMAVAVSKAKELGLKKLAVPSAGNAGGALACYSARAGLSAKVFMPKDTPESMVRECAAYGAEVVLVEGNIGDAGLRMKTEMGGYFEMSTFKEPYRLEGKKTMGYEIAEQTGFDLPDVIVYPTGGGTGLIGMWKSFDEMEELGWIGTKRPRMFSVQSAECAPIVEAFSSGREEPDPSFPDGSTIAAGLRVPRPFAGRQMLAALRESKGGAVSVPESEIYASLRSLAKAGIFACPEGAATLAGYNKLVAAGEVDGRERTLLYNTGTGLKYLNLFE